MSSRRFASVVLAHTLVGQKMNTSDFTIQEHGASMVRPGAASDRRADVGELRAVANPWASVAQSHKLSDDPFVVINSIVCSFCLCVLFVIFLFCLPFAWFVIGKEFWSDRHAGDGVKYYVISISWAQELCRMISFQRVVPVHVIEEPEDGDALQAIVAGVDRIDRTLLPYTIPEFDEHLVIYGSTETVVEFVPMEDGEIIIMCPGFSGQDSINWDQCRVLANNPGFVLNDAVEGPPSYERSGAYIASYVPDVGFMFPPPSPGEQPYDDVLVPWTRSIQRPTRTFQSRHNVPVFIAPDLIFRMSWGQSCNICQDDVCAGAPCYVLACGHVVCWSCVFPLVRHHDLCPTCRRVLLDPYRYERAHYNHNFWETTCEQEATEAMLTHDHDWHHWTRIGEASNPGHPPARRRRPDKRSRQRSKIGGIFPLQQIPELLTIKGTNVPTRGSVLVNMPHSGPSAFTRRIRPGFLCGLGVWDLLDCDKGYKPDVAIARVHGQTKNSDMLSFIVSVANFTSNNVLQLCYLHNERWFECSNTVTWIDVCRMSNVRGAQITFTKPVDLNKFKESGLRVGGSVDGVVDAPLPVAPSPPPPAVISPTINTRDRPMPVVSAEPTFSRDWTPEQQNAYLSTFLSKKMVRIRDSDVKTQPLVSSSSEPKPATTLILKRGGLPSAPSSTCSVVGRLGQFTLCGVRRNIKVAEVGRLGALTIRGVVAACEPRNELGSLTSTTDGSPRETPYQVSDFITLSQVQYLGPVQMSTVRFSEVSEQALSYRIRSAYDEHRAILNEAAVVVQRWYRRRLATVAHVRHTELQARWREFMQRKNHLRLWSKSLDTAPEANPFRLVLAASCSGKSTYCEGDQRCVDADAIPDVAEIYAYARKRYGQKWWELPASVIGSIQSAVFDFVVMYARREYPKVVFTVPPPLDYDIAGLGNFGIVSVVLAPDAYHMRCRMRNRQPSIGEDWCTLHSIPTLPGFGLAVECYFSNVVPEVPDVANSIDAASTGVFDDRDDLSSQRALVNELAGINTFTGVCGEQVTIAGTTVNFKDLTTDEAADMAPRSFDASLLPPLIQATLIGGVRAPPLFSEPAVLPSIHSDSLLTSLGVGAVHTIDHPTAVRHLSLSDNSGIEFLKLAPNPAEHQLAVHTDAWVAKVNAECSSLPPQEAPPPATTRIEQCNFSDFDFRLPSLRTNPSASSHFGRFVSNLLSSMTFRASDVAGVITKTELVYIMREKFPDVDDRFVGAHPRTFYEGLDLGSPTLLDGEETFRLADVLVISFHFLNVLIRLPDLIFSVALAFPNAFRSGRIIIKFVEPWVHNFKDVSIVERKAIVNSYKLGNDKLVAFDPQLAIETLYAEQIEVTHLSYSKPIDTQVLDYYSSARKTVVGVLFSRSITETRFPFVRQGYKDGRYYLAGHSQFTVTTTAAGVVIDSSFYAQPDPSTFETLLSAMLSGELSDPRPLDLFPPYIVTPYYHLIAEGPECLPKKNVTEDQLSRSLLKIQKEGLTPTALSAMQVQIEEAKASYLEYAALLFSLQLRGYKAPS
jgi:hypothetical protein